MYFLKSLAPTLKATTICIWYGELNIVGELADLKEFGMFKGREIVSSETWFWKSLDFPQTLDSSKIVT